MYELLTTCLQNHLNALGDSGRYFYVYTAGLMISEQGLENLKQSKVTAGDSTGDGSTCELVPVTSDSRKMGTRDSSGREAEARMTAKT